MIEEEEIPYEIEKMIINEYNHSIQIDDAFIYGVDRDDDIGDLYNALILNLHEPQPGEKEKSFVLKQIFKAVYVEACTRLKETDEVRIFEIIRDEPNWSLQPPIVEYVYFHPKLKDNLINDLWVQKNFDKTMETVRQTWPKALDKPPPKKEPIKSDRYCDFELNNDQLAFIVDPVFTASLEKGIRNILAFKEML